RGPTSTISLPMSPDAKPRDDGQDMEDDGQDMEDDGQDMEDDGQDMEDDGQDMEDDGQDMEKGMVAASLRGTKISSTFPRLVSVVIPARNAAAVIAGQFEGLSRQEYRGAWELIVADNASTDDTA